MRANSESIVAFVEASAALARVQELFASQCRALDAAALFPDKASPVASMDLAPAVEDLHVADLERIDAALGGHVTEDLARLRAALTHVDEETQEDVDSMRGINDCRAAVVSRLAADPHRGLRIMEGAIQARAAQDVADDANPHSIRSIRREVSESQPDAHA